MKLQEAQAQYECELHNIDIHCLPQGSFLESTGAIFSSSESKNGDVYTPENACTKGT